MVASSLLEAPPPVDADVHNAGDFFMYR
jgi:hypothetical protein